jgi:hypothetical protein
MSTKETINEVVKLVVIALIGGISVVIADIYADFRGVRKSEQKAEKAIDYAHKMDSLNKIDEYERSENKRKEYATWLSIKQSIANHKEITLEAMQIAEDTIFNVTNNQKDSIRNILLKE